MRICTAAEMRELDRLSQTEYQIDETLLMENAGRAAVTTLFEYYPTAGRDSEVLVFAGKGNNAGDAFVVARRLLCLDRRVRVFHLVPENQYQGATRKSFEILKRLKAKMTQLEATSDLESFFSSSSGPFVVIDGILGTGIKGMLSGIFHDVIELVNKNTRHVISLDIPSGIHPDTGAVHGTSIAAELTISYGFPKLGHFLPPGAARRGQLVNVDISLPPRFRREGDKFLLMRNQMSALLQERDRYGHKNSFGHTLLIGGSPGRMGAIAMAARACHKMGTGLVTVASWDDCMAPLATKLPDETMSVPLHFSGPEVETYKNRLPTYSSLVVGPGLGLRKGGKELLEEILSLYQGPLVLDADALNLVADHGMHARLQQRKGRAVLTPRPGEMARLLGKTKEQVVENPIGAVKECVERTHAVVLLKGAATVIGSTDNVIYLNHYPNDGMATAGTGDVLAGMIGGLAGQKMDLFQAAQLGVYLHSLAGELSAEAQGHRAMTARDIIDNIGRSFQSLMDINAPDFPEEGRAKLR